MSNLADLMNSPWAIVPNNLKEIRNIYEAHTRGEKINIANVEAQLGRKLNNETQGVDVINGVAVITAYGPISKRANMMTQVSGGVSTEILRDQFRASIHDEKIKAIIFDVDSPGGTVDGTFELADEIYKARGSKPIVSLANGLMASAAYAIGSATDSIYMTGLTTHVGSIGVVAAHTDYSGYEEKQGIKTTEIYAGKYKRISSQYAPLSDAGKESIQDSVDYLYSIFVERVSQYRGVNVNTVLTSMADGRLFIGMQAVDAGLVDGVSSLDELVASLSTGSYSNKTKSIKIQREEISMANNIGPMGVEKKAQEEWETDPNIRAEFGRYETFLAFSKGTAKNVTGKDNTIRTVDSISVEKKAQEEWDTDPNIRAEFGRVETFLAFKKAEARGSVKIYNGGGVVHGRK